MKKISKDQPKSFTFSNENLTKVQKIISKYPNNKKASAVMPLLHLVQEQNQNWIPLIALKYKT